MAATEASLDRHELESALLAWRKADELARTSWRPLLLASYGRAIIQVVGELAAHQTVADLVGAYQRAGPGMAEAACAEQPEGPFLVRSLVVDAAFWWRFRALVAAAAGLPTL